MNRKEGQWNRNQFVQGVDSSLHGKYHNNNVEVATRLALAAITGVKTEPAFLQTTVDIDFILGGKKTHVAWPGGQVNAGSSGTPSAVTDQIHGLWEAPLPGQQVLVGFVEGSKSDPIVINKYPYNVLHDPIYQPAYNNPLAAKEHNPLDIILGHFTGSWFALRGVMPVPGHIDINSVSSMEISSEVETIIKSVTMTFKANDTGEVKMDSNGDIGLTNGTSTINVKVSGDIDLTNGASNVKVKSSGLVSIFNSAQNLKTLMDDFIDAVSGLQTVGSPANHVVNPAGQAALAALKVRFDTLLGDS